jgi:hypothetical protein
VRKERQAGTVPDSDVVTAEKAYCCLIISLGIEADVARRSASSYFHLFWCAIFQWLSSRAGGALDTAEAPRKHP